MKLPRCAVSGGPGAGARLLRTGRAIVSTVAAAAALVGASPLAGHAQSLLAREGLGIVVEPLDARARGIGSAGVGMNGWYVSQLDPAAGAGLLLPSVSASLQPATTTLTDGREAGFTRFPTLAISYPLSGNVLSIQAGSSFDQEWRVQHERTLVLAGDEVPAEDTYISDGGIGRVQLGWARRILPSLALGATFGSHVGTVERRFERAILDTTNVVVQDVGSFGISDRLEATGLVAGAGAVWDPMPVVRMSGSILWFDDLTLSPPGEEEGQERSYSLPLQYRLGGTATLTDELSLHLSGSFADWSDIGDDLLEGSARGATWSYGGGLGWSGLNVLDRTFPLRLGYRHNDLPFETGGEPVYERTFSGGLGVNLVEVEGEVEPRARADFGLERGLREGGAISEEFLRATFTVRVSSG